MLGELIKGFKVVRQLGKGGMGEVWVAEQQIVKTQVAIKRLLAELSKDQPAVQRLFNEAIAVSKIKHAGIVRIYDVGFHKGSAFLIMELLEGETLAGRIKRAGYLPLGQVGDIGRQIASVIDATHSAGITHRDLKPDNIFLVEDAELANGERVKILDFGIAKIGTTLALTGADIMMGTPGYMAPEQWNNAAGVDGRADIYALGCIAFKMCSGRLPFEVSSLPEAYAAHIGDIPPRVRNFARDVPAELDEAIAATLEKRPEHRPSLRELSRVFAAVAAAHPIGPRGRLEPTPRPVGPHQSPPTEPPSGIGDAATLPPETTLHGVMPSRPSIGPGVTQLAMPVAVMSEDDADLDRRDPDAGFGALDTDYGPLPLVAMDVSARVAGIVTAIEVAQTFVNATNAVIEATYVFPLPDRAAVHRLTLQVGDRVVEGVIDERQAVLAYYEQAVAAGYRATIAEQQLPGVFTLRVGNLMPGDTATVRLSLVGPLPVDDGEVTFRFPLVVAPRYLPMRAMGESVATASGGPSLAPSGRTAPAVWLSGFANPVRLGLRLAFEGGSVREIASSLSAMIAGERGAQVVEVALGERPGKPGEPIDRDFILRWRVDTAELWSQLVCAGDAGGAGGSFALTVVPPSAASIAAAARDVVFVVNRSASMAGWKLVAARRAAARMIDTLSARDRFSLIGFAARAELLVPGGLVSATDRNRYRAIEALTGLAAGDAELTGALRAAIGAWTEIAAERPRLVVLVTDGQGAPDDQALRELGEALHGIKLIALCLDPAADAGPLQRLASASRGLCELVESEDRLDAVIARVHQRLGTPLAMGLSLAPSGMKLERESMAPLALPDVYAGAPIVIFGRYRGVLRADAAIDVEGASPGAPLRLTVAMSPVAAGSWLAASWARAHICDLEDRYAARPRPELMNQIIWVSKQFGVLSRFTAFVAVDHSQQANAGGRIFQVVQPAVAMPERAAKIMGMPRASGPHGAPSTPYGSVEGMPRGVPVGSSPPPMPGGRSPAPALPYLPAPSIPMGAPVPPSAMQSARSPAPAPGGPPPAPAAPLGAPPQMPGGQRPRAPLPSRSWSSDAPDRGLESLDRDDVVDAPLSVGAGRRDPSAQWIVKLRGLVEQLAERATASDAEAVVKLQQELREWAAAVRAAGLLDELAKAVDTAVKRLTSALAVPAKLAAKAADVADLLRALIR